MALSDILDGIGNVLSAPRNMLYKHVLSPLLGGDVNSFGDILTNKLGMDPENFATKALGFMGDIGTDPLTYAGGFGASALRNKLFGETANLGRAASSSAKGLSVMPELRATAEATPVVWGTRLEQAAEGAKPGLSALEGRPGFRLSSGVGPEGTVLTGEVSPGSAVHGSRALTSNAEEIRNKLGDLGIGKDYSIKGVFDRDTGTIFNGYDRPILNEAGHLPADAATALGTTRHEMMHALTRAAEADPTLQAKLPFLSRTAARLGTSESPLLRGLGVITDEMGAHAAQARNLGGQIRNAGHVLFDPDTVEAYSRMVGHKSPLAASLYRMLPGTFPVAGAATGYGLSSSGY